MASIRRNNPSFQFIQSLWQKYSPLEKEHSTWLKTHIRIKSHLPKGTLIHLYGERKREVYIVCKGAIARVYYDKNNKLHILTIALPGMSLMSTTHLYSRTPAEGHIITLQANTSLVHFSYKALIEGKSRYIGIGTLINVLLNKKKKQLAQLSILHTINAPIERYIWFAEHMQQLRTELTHKEAAQLLGISVDTVYRALRKWLKS